jgi:Protein of unknown function (DUF1566)
MRRVSVGAAAFALTAMGFMFACTAMAANTASYFDAQAPDAGDAAGALHTHEALPDIGTRMPDGRVYAGLSMDTGKPSYVAAAGGRMPDGTVYAGVSPDTNKALYTTPEDAPGIYTWSEGIAYCKALSAAGHLDWRMPTIGELAVQFNNRADIGGFNETGRMQHASGYYWSSLQVGDEAAWAQSFKDGFHENPSKDTDSSLRCVR